MDDISPEKLLYRIALTQIPGVGDITARHLLQVVGDEEAIFKSSRKSLQTIKGISTKLVDEIVHADVLKRAEEELLFVKKNNITTYFINEKMYPQRLRDCVDAPILLYYKGNADLNSVKIVSMVGTRNATNYGSDFCDSFLKQMATAYPDVLIVSGLAYGIDIHAHRFALKHGLPTVGVLAHGLDRIYPSVHRQTAAEMVEMGGLLTDFPSKTEPERFNFVRRNRIVAALCDALIVVESDDKGGSLITAEIANSYCKDIFAVPGRSSDRYSRGCNKLIASHKADLLLSTDYFLQQMGWDSDTKKKKAAPKQQELFLNLTAEQQAIKDALDIHQNLHIDQLAMHSGIPLYQLFPVLLELEMLGVIQNLPGNVYALA